MSIDLSVSTYSLSKWRQKQNKTMAHTIDWLADAGVRCIEFSGLEEKPADDPIKIAQQYRRRCEKRGLRIVNYCTGAELLGSAATQKKAIRATCRQVDIAAALGVTQMRHDVTWGFDRYKGYRGVKTFAAALKIIVPAIREIADYAQAQGIRTSLENHGFFMQGSKRVEKLLQTVNHPNFGLTLDMGNFMCVDENPVEAVQRLIPYAQMIHVKDFHVKAKKDMPPVGWFATPKTIALRGAIVGHGVIDIPKQLRILKKAKYRGVLSLEFEGMEEPTQAVTLGLDYLRTQLKKIKL